MGIKDFREKYFSIRDELRRVKRFRESQKRAKQKELWERQRKNKNNEKINNDTIIVQT